MSILLSVRVNLPFGSIVTQLCYQAPKTGAREDEGLQSEGHRGSKLNTITTRFHKRRLIIDHPDAICHSLWLEAADDAAGTGAFMVYLIRSEASAAAADKVEHGLKND